MNLSNSYKLLCQLNPRNYRIRKYLPIQLIIIFVSLSICPAKNYKGAEYRTIEAYTYGRFEARYKAPLADGVLASFFTYHEIVSSSEWNEIDIEILGRYDDEVQFNTITPRQINHVRHNWVDFSPQTDFHTYAFEWTPDYVAWFIDNQEVYRQTEEHIATLIYEQKIMMNIWNPVFDNWVGPWDEVILPVFAYYDWVSYASYTPGEGTYGTDNNFTLQWRDDFDAFDDSRWQKATHTFAGNNCDFLPENVVFQDGFMILCLTDDTNIGFVDVKPSSALWARSNNKNKIIVRFSEQIDQQSSELPANYGISGIEIHSAKLLADCRTVELTVSDLDLSASYNLLVHAIYDRAPNPNKLIVQVVNIILTQALNFPLKINVAGLEYDTYQADQNWDPGVEFGHLDGSDQYYDSDLKINNTDEEELYRTARRGIVAYKIRVPNGQYRVKLKMAENHFTETGMRIFDIIVEGDTLISNLDIYQQSGVNTAYDLVADAVDVFDKQLDIHFCAIKDEAILSGLELEQISTGIGYDNIQVVETFALQQNYPNPFNPKTVISWHVGTIPASSVQVDLSIYNTLGQKVATLVSAKYTAGYHEVEWDASDIASGIYYYCMEASGFHDVKKMILVK